MTTDDYMDVFVSGEWRRIPTPLWDVMRGRKPPRGYVSNGCTLSPDAIRGRQVWPACVLHDYHTTGPGLSYSRREADALLRRNVEAVLKAQGVFVLLAKAIAFVYWRGVRRGGKALYKGSGDPA